MIEHSIGSSVLPKFLTAMLYEQTVIEDLVKLA